MRRLAAFAVAATLAWPAQGFPVLRQTVTVPVVPISATEFEVVRASFTSPANIWCGAGTYARKVLGQRGGKLWVAQGLAPSKTVPGQKSMIFSTAPVTPDKTTYTYTLNEDGVVKSTAAATGACNLQGPLVFIEVQGKRFRASL